MDSYQHFLTSFHRFQEELAKAREFTEQALAASRAGEIDACLRAARTSAAEHLRVFLRFAGSHDEAGADDLVALVNAAAAQDHYFERLRPEAKLLMTSEAEAHRLHCETIIEALKEIRMLSSLRAKIGVSPDWPHSELDPFLRRFVVHSTLAERAVAISAAGAIYSFNQCLRRGLFSGEPVGSKLLLDPRRWLDFVHFGSPSPTFYAGEKVANAHRKGWIDESLDEDYQPSARLFFKRADLEALPGCEDDGCHLLMVRDQVSLDYLACAAFPSDDPREAALAAVKDGARRDKLRGRCLAVPPDCISDPRSYVTATNQAALNLLREA
jgi:hypothetical protein